MAAARERELSSRADLKEPSKPELEARPDELESALGACDFPLVVWSTSDAVIRMGNRRAAELFGLALDDLVGRRLQDLVAPSQAVSEVAAQLAAGELSAVAGERRLRNLDITVRTWTRGIQLGDERGGISVFVPIGEVGSLGRDPTRPLRDLYPVAVGLIRADWRVSAVSAEIRDLTGLEPSEVIGSVLLELVHPDDRGKLEAPGAAPPANPISRCSIRLSDRVSGWVDSCWLLAPAEVDRFAFAILGRPRTTTDGERIAELELRLRRIAAELRAAGVLDNITDVPSAAMLDELPELSTRQWEILSLLLQGKRVKTIARDLYVSPSTVRNHLTAIFRKFAVHSQAELLEALHS